MITFQGGKDQDGSGRQQQEKYLCSISELSQSSYVLQYSFQADLHVSLNS